MSVIQFALRQPVYQLVQVHKLLHNVFIKTDTGDMSNGVLMGFGFIDIILEYLRICLFNNNKIPYSLMLRPEINYTPVPSPLSVCIHNFFLYFFYRITCSSIGKISRVNVMVKAGIQLSFIGHGKKIFQDKHKKRTSCRK